ncbi:SRPBCC domain-containing protein [Amycolatopsis sp. NPDC059027]|uniref:SRPBCC domain-containing protein n=1 Tax=Amycolatopsis sp. NPDC059027 TaxID=3346709 RepID=UPI00366A7DC5
MTQGSLIRTVVDVAAPPEAVWRVLVDFGRYSRWHPTMVVDDPVPEAVPGAKLKLRVSGGVAGDQSFTAEIVEALPPRRLVWLGGVPDVLLGRHSFEVEPLASGRSRYTDTETWSGSLVATVIAEQYEAITAEYERVVRALKTAVEAG